MLMLNNQCLKAIEVFKYLRDWVNCCETYINIRKVPTWTACHKLQKILESRQPRGAKIKLFLTTFWIGDSKTEAIIKCTEKCQWLLSKRYYMWPSMWPSRQKYITNECLCGILLKVSEKIKECRHHQWEHLK